MGRLTVIFFLLVGPHGFGTSWSEFCVALCGSIAVPLRIPSACDKGLSFFGGRVRNTSCQRGSMPLLYNATDADRVDFSGPFRLSGLHNPLCAGAPVRAGRAIRPHVMLASAKRVQGLRPLKNCNSLGTRVPKQFSILQRSQTLQETLLVCGEYRPGLRMRQRC